MSLPPRFSLNQSQPLVPALNHNGYEDNLQLPFHTHNPQTSYCSPFVEGRLVLQIPIHSRPFLSTSFFTPSFLSHYPFLFFGLSAIANHFDAGRLPISRALAIVFFLKSMDVFETDYSNFFVAEVVPSTRSTGRSSSGSQLCQAISSSAG
jgi:hypothetical protein